VWRGIKNATRHKKNIKRVGGPSPIVRLGGMGGRNQSTVGTVQKRGGAVGRKNREGKEKKKERRWSRRRASWTLTKVGREKSALKK